MKKEEQKNNKKRAFSVMEIMIALLIITIILAAATPFMTKRRVIAEYGKAAVWNEVAGQPESVYFYPGDEHLTSTAYFGLDPTSVNEKLSARVVVKANDSATMPTGVGPQRMITFRKDDSVVGSLYMDNNENYMLGTPNSNLVKNHSSNVGNTVLGTGAMGKIKEASHSVAIGSNAAAGGATDVVLKPDAYVIAVGANALKNIKGGGDAETDSGIYIGANAGVYAEKPNNNIAIGSGAMSSKFVGTKSIVIGYNAGLNHNNGIGSYDIIVGNNTPVFSGDNILIGYHSGYDKTKPTYYTTQKIGAIGSDTCAKKGALCIGYQSGYDPTNVQEGGVYIGGKPSNFPGAAVLEVVPSSGSSTNNDAVIMNSNLVVRGNIYMSNPSASSDTFSVMQVPNRLLTINDGFSAWSGYWSDGTSSYYHTCMSGSTWVPNSTSGTGPLATPPSQNGFLFSYSESSEKKCSDSKNSYNFSTECPKLTSSDKRLKENILPSEIGLKELKKLEAYDFTFKNDDRKTPQVGVIAQNLQKVFPNAVSTDEKGYLKIRLDEMFFAMINAIKELNARITKLAEQVLDIKTDIETAQTSHKKIAQKIKELDKRVSKLEH